MCDRPAVADPTAREGSAPTGRPRSSPSTRLSANRARRRRPRLCACAARRSWLLPDRDVFAALARERLAIPAAPPFAQAHVREAGHQVELGRRHRAEWHRQPLPAVVDEREVMADEPLRRRVVLIDPGVRVAQVEDTEPTRTWNTDLDDEAAAGRELCGDVLEARDLRVLCRQVVDRVEDEVREREGLTRACRGEVADGDGDVLAARLRPELRDHVGREVDAVNANAARHERQRDATRADPEFEGRTVAREIGEELDGCGDDRTGS